MKCDLIKQIITLTRYKIKRRSLYFDIDEIDSPRAEFEPWCPQTEHIFFAKLSKIPRKFFEINLFQFHQKTEKNRRETFEPKRCKKCNSIKKLRKFENVDI